MKLLKQFVICIVLTLSMSSLVFSQAPSDTVKVGNYFWVKLNADFVDNCVIDHIGADLHYDSTLCKYVSHTMQNIFDIELLQLENDEQGIINLAWSNTETTSPVGVDGMIVAIRFLAASPGTVNFSFINNGAKYKEKDVENNWESKLLSLEEEVVIQGRVDISIVIEEE